MTFTVIDYRRKFARYLPHMANPETQARWDTVLKALDGIALGDLELQMFREITGRSQPRPDGYSELVTIVGRQAGKDDLCADAINADAVASILNGESCDGLSSIGVAQDHRSSVRTLFHRIARPWRTIPVLKKHVAASTSDSFTLDNGLLVGVLPCRPAAPRGLRMRRAVMNESEHYRNSVGFPMDVEMRRAILPTLATTGGKLIIVSSPYMGTGLLGELHRRHWGRDDSSTLIVQGSAPMFNPTLPADYLERMREDDPEAYASEVLGLFRQGTSAFLDEETIASCTGPYRERLPQSGTRYVGHYDASGGAHDAASACVGHRDGKVTIVDAVRRWPAPHDPRAVIAEAAQFFHQYRVRSIEADRYAGQHPASEFRAHGISLDHCEMDRSALYLNLLPRARSVAVQWPNDLALLRELRGLVRKRGFAGKDRVDHRPGAFDDVAVSMAGVVYQATKERRGGGEACRVLGL